MYFLYYCLEIVPFYRTQLQTRLTRHLSVVNKNIMFVLYKDILLFQ